MKMDVAKNPMMEMKMKDQKTDGEVLFDVEAGELHSMSINQNITLDMVAAGQTMPGTIDQNIEVKVTPATEKIGAGENSEATIPTETAAAKPEAAAK